MRVGTFLKVGMKFVVCGVLSLVASCSATSSSVVPDGGGATSFSRGAVITTSSTYSTSHEGSRIVDGDVQTSWYAESAACTRDGGSGPYVCTNTFAEARLSQTVTVSRVTIRGNRDYESGYDIHTGRVSMFDAEGTMVFASEVLIFPEPTRDLVLTLPTPRAGVRLVRVTILTSDNGGPGFSELEVN